MTASQVGIEAMNVYCGLAQIPVEVLFEARGLNRDRLGNLMMDQKTVGLPFEDPITNAVNAAKPIVDALTPEQKERIEVLITPTESGIDYSKSIASYVHQHLGLSRRCRFIEAKQACYAATGAVQMGIAYVASGMSPGAKVLVISTDVTLADGRSQYIEPVVGPGSAAILISESPRILTVDFGAFGNYAFETLDSARPTGYTTTLKLMQIMAEKGLVARDQSSRTHLYSAKLPQHHTQRQFVTDMIAKVFGGSSAQLVMHALSSHAASKEELAEIKELIETQKDAKKGEKR